MLDDRKLEHLKELIETQTELRFMNEGMTSDVHKPAWKVKVIPGRKYTKVDIGSSGRYMIDNSTGIIYGIKAYGVVHRGHVFGTIDTVDQWNWGGYYAFPRN